MKRSGRVQGVADESWKAIDSALRHGYRGFPGGSSLAQLLLVNVGRVHRLAQRRLTETQIVGWARSHKARTGKWPARRSGRIAVVGNESWQALDRALRKGHRGLRGGESLASLLLRAVGHVPQAKKVRLNNALILEWADEHHRRTREWPACTTGAILGQTNETWRAIDLAMRGGGRGLKPGYSLARLLAEHRGVFTKVRPDTELLTVRQILAWADAHHRHTGQWPRPNSGRLDSPPFTTWGAIDWGLRAGRYDAPPRTSLLRILQKHRGVSVDIPWHGTLRESEILEWVDDFHSRTGAWPSVRSGRVNQRPELTWSAINSALNVGSHGLAGKSSLPRLLLKHRGVRSKGYAPRLSAPEILQWARDHHRRTGKWPASK
ncbi:MAG TPA: hypothetical protein VNT79_16740, partial [Phycisphaerae bacterium]|nr:hypothetical protein [Phycisphaerae bacterium]